MTCGVLAAEARIGRWAMLTMYLWEKMTLAQHQNSATLGIVTCREFDYV